MGCDIHTYLEIKNNKGEWETADLFRKNKYYPSPNGDEREFEVHNFYKDRDYNLFAILADVRNYDEVKPISYERGIPEDCCQTIKHEYQRWDLDGHSASWFTLKELIDYYENNIGTKVSGMVSPETSDNLDKGILPSMYCLSTTDKTWIKREWTEPNPVGKLIRLMKIRANELYYIYDFLWGREEDKQEVDEKASNMRVVFWFDN